MRMDRFCRKCGRRLDVQAVDSKRHSEANGERLYYIRFICPNNTWFLDGHANYYAREGGFESNWKKTFDKFDLESLGYGIHGL